jgi:sporulation protein YlmC with PRC-barrel domain/ribosomal protein L40E
VAGSKLEVRLLAEKYYKREELVGKHVYDAKAKRIGPVSDIAYSKDGKTALIVGGTTISFEKISEIGDIIILKAEQNIMPELSAPKRVVELVDGQKICPKCDRKNEKPAKFCIKCGYRFQYSKEVEKESMSNPSVHAGRIRCSTCGHELVYSYVAPQRCHQCGSIL